MKLSRPLSIQTVLGFAFVLVSPLTSAAQATPVPARVTQAVDVEKLVTLPGSTHPLARPEDDRGNAPDSLPIGRMLLVLRRGADEEAALRKLLDEQQIKSSPNYHQWLTPEQFGQQFGPADADIQAVTSWLASQAFQVSSVAAGRAVIEFSGTAGLVRQAFHTEMHRFVVNGEEHWANASDPQIPAALAPVVAGFASLNNFPRTPMIRNLGAFSRSKATGEVRPLFTFTSGDTSYYALGPTDFATIYSVSPLWQAGTDGTGQTIAIVGQSNINIQDVRDFRSLFGLPANDPQIILNGPDPGVTQTASESEAILDVEWAGAVAKNATIALVVSEATESTWGMDLSALYVVDNNLAPVMSASYGACEAYLGAGGNAFYNTLWEQGAAQGITISAASGDSGSATCDYAGYEVAAQYGLAVSGTASTPFNVAVGGTDFDDANNWSTYWSTTNNSTTLSSAKSYIPESTWNDSCARFGQASSCASAGSDTPAGIDLVAGGGGPSNCATFTATGDCQAGYAKPSWQTGTGVPSDGARDIPDVSLFAGVGLNRSFYVICEADALPPGYISCNRNYDTWYFLGAGGTSASAPAFAGIMALVNQKTGERQGNANYVLYPLAAKSGVSCTSNASAVTNSSCVFYDVVTGNNSVACQGGSPNCSATTSGAFGILVNPSDPSSPAWTTTTRYDPATGLGSVNAKNLVNKWTSVSFAPSTTTLSLSTTPATNPITLTHGQSVDFTINVAPTSGSGTPTGDVSLIAQTSSTQSNGIGPFTLSGGSVTSATNMLPGGSYNVIAHYAGNGAIGASDSNAVPVTVSAESSLTSVELESCDYITGVCTRGVTNAVYGSSFLMLRMDVTNASGQPCASEATGLISYPCPTGTVSATANGQAPPDYGNPPGSIPGTYALNSQGYAEDQFVQFSGGTYNLAASYTGGNSYGASTSPTDGITITQASTTTALSSPSSVVGPHVVLTATINTQSYGGAPTGWVQFLDGSTTLGSAWVSGNPYNPSTGAFASGKIVYAALLPAGTHAITAQYSGDTYFYAASTSPAITITVTDFSLSVDPSSINIPVAGQSGTSTLTITPLYGFSATVNVSCYNYSLFSAGISCTVSPSSINVTGSSAVTATVTITTTAQVSATAPTPERRVPPSFRLPVGLPSLLAGLLALATLMSVATIRRHPAAWLFGAALLVAGVWAACGGGGGGGLRPPPPPAPVVSLSPASLTFSQQNMNSTSALQCVTLSNTGNASLSISSITIGGGDSEDFAQTNTCSTSVAAGAKCTISVTFTPTTAAARSSWLVVTDNANLSPQTVSLTGTGIPQATPPGTYSVGLNANSGTDWHNLPISVTVQ